MNYFTDEEFKCPCCGQNWVDKEFKESLNIARGISQTPYKINSGCRCKEHNKAVGGTSTSSHLEGIAVDIKCNSATRLKILKGLITAGFKRIGIAKTFIHVDSDTQKSKVSWTY